MFCSTFYQMIEILKHMPYNEGSFTEVMQMDPIDNLLVRMLAKNSDVTATELSAQVNLSVPAINKRIARLKSSGVIQACSILTNPKKVGKPIVAFVMVVLDQFNNSDSLLQYAQSDPDVLECYAVTGEYDYLLKICAADVNAFEDKLLHLKRSRGVAKSHTLLSLKEEKFAPSALPDAPED